MNSIRKIAAQNNVKSPDRGNKSSYLSDKTFEEVSMKYLEKSRIFEDLNIKNEDIVTDRARQLKGIDCIATIENTPAYVDVKAIASQLPTFCFEISGNVNSGQVGWLLKEDLVTDYYLIVYHTVEGAERNYRLGKRIMTLDNVVSTEAFLIKKDKLKNRIEQEFGMSLTDVVQKIRGQDFSDRKSVVRFDNKAEVQKGKEVYKIYPTLSPNIYEQPINVVVRKEIFFEIAEQHWTI